MKIIMDEKALSKNIKFTKISLYASLIVLGLGFVISLATPNTLPNLIYAAIALIAGYILFRVNMGLAVRWGNSPRPDEKLATALKGLPNEYTLYNYASDVPYLLLGPTGIWLFELVEISGSIYFDQGSEKWKIKKQGGFLRRILSSDNVGDLRRTYSNLKIKWENYIKEKWDQSNLPKPNIALIMSNPELEIEGKDPFITLIRIDKLKDQIRKNPQLPTANIESIAKFEKQILPK